MMLRTHRAITVPRVAVNRTPAQEEAIMAVIEPNKAATDTNPPPAVQQDSEYLAKRTLKKGTAGWLLLAGLGVSYVISGDYSGWNFGLDEGGWGGLMIAAVLMGLMYTCMVFGLAEMSSALPVAGAGYGFARRSMGPLGGFATGMAVLIEYAVAPAAIAVFIGGYVE